MQGRIIFLVEEPSMKALLDGLLPRLFPGWIERQHFQCVAHEGKSDLDRSVPRKLANWRIPGDRFVVVRDNDGADCTEIKARLTAMCDETGRKDTLIRLVCQELEGWYLGDLVALGMAFDAPKVDTPAHRKRFANPDSWLKPSIEVKRLVPSFQKGSGARAVAPHLEPRRNVSHSFGVFLTGVRQVASDMGYVSPN
jgi:hypothetical protein